MCNEFNSSRRVLPATRMYVEQRTDFSPQLFLPWDLMTVFLNIYSQYNNMDNIAILPGYVSTKACQLKDCRLEGRTLNFKNNRDEKAIAANRDQYKNLYQSLLALIPKSARDGLLDKRLIVYVTNPNLSHWCCTFIFNIKNYIMKMENDLQNNEQSKKKTDYNFELSGFSNMIH